MGLAILIRPVPLQLGRSAKRGSFSARPTSNAFESIGRATAWQIVVTRAMKTGAMGGRLPSAPQAKTFATYACSQRPWGAQYAQTRAC